MDPRRRVRGFEERSMSDDARLVKAVTTLYERLFRPDLDQLGTCLGGEIRVLRADVAALKQSVAEIRGDAADFRRDTDGHFDAVYQRFDRLETEYHMLAEGLRRVEKEVASHAALLRP
jgi:hypothetical protein